MRPGGERARLGVALVKITPPRVPHRYLPRPRLTAELDAAAPEQVTLVSAPAGYGKTLMLADWATRHPERTAWVSLDAYDNDDHHLWAAVLAALATCPAVGDALGGIDVPEAPSRDGAFVAGVVNGLALLAEPVRLVLDDVHELAAPEPLQGLAALVRHRPPTLHLVLSGRTDPPLSLVRMRLSGELQEIRARQLRFSVAEAAVMLAAADVDVRPDQVDLLVEQTAGWPAGLRLAALSLREAEDPDRFLADFVANDRAVSDYLVSEILDRLPPDTLDLLRAVSICDQLPVELAVLLSDRPDAGDVLAALERQTSLILGVGEGRAHYRVHPLLRAHLRADLQRRRPELAARLHARAARWFTALDLPIPALEHARHTGTAEQTLALLHRYAVALVAEGRRSVVRHALGRLGGARVAADAGAALVAALIAAEEGDPAAAHAHLAHAERAGAVEGSTHLRALRGVVRTRLAGLVGDPRALLALVTGAPPELPPELDRVAGLQLDLALATLAGGDVAGAKAAAEEAVRRAEQHGQCYHLARGLAVLAATAGADGDYRRMAELAERADGILPAAEWRSTAGAALCSVVRATGALLRAEPGLCLELLAPAAQFVDAPGGAPRVGVAPLVAALHGAALVDLGRAGAGLDELRAAQADAAQRAGGPGQNATVAVLTHTAATHAGHHQLARTVLAWAEEVAPGTGEVVLMRARQLATRGRPAEAAEALGRLLGGDAPPTLRWVLVEAHVLGCRLALLTDHRAAARAALDGALALAGETGVLRPLALGPPEFLDLLIRNLGSFGHTEPVAARALEIHDALRPGREPVALTERERAVLRLLPTQRTLHEIADDLTVSHSTVKTHVRGIYGKLGVSSRRDAVAAARRHGIA
ncbi:MAG: LuxR C-terminal-related transcriptional regulator [Pseudonocardia sp.]